jgi:hypothetical protein
MPGSWPRPLAPSRAGFAPRRRRSRSPTVSHDLAEIVLMAALVPMLPLMAALLTPSGIVAASAWRGRRKRSPRPAPTLEPPVAVLPAMKLRAA